MLDLEFNSRYHSSEEQPTILTVLDCTYQLQLRCFLPTPEPKSFKTESNKHKDRVILHTEIGKGRRRKQKSLDDVMFSARKQKTGIVNTN